MAVDDGEESTRGKNPFRETFHMHGTLDRLTPSTLNASSDTLDPKLWALSQELEVKERSLEAAAKIAEQTKQGRLTELVKREGRLADAEKAVEEREAAARDALRREKEAAAKLDSVEERERACEERERLLDAKRSEVRACGAFSPCILVAPDHHNFCRSR